MVSSKLKTPFTPRLLADIVAASPEGFFHRDRLTDSRFDPDQQDEVIRAAIAEGGIGLWGDYLYDPARLSPEQVAERSAWYAGSLPPLKSDGTPSARPIAERMQNRARRLAALGEPVLARLVAAFEGTPGYLPTETLCAEPGDEGALAILQEMKILKRLDGMVFDPLRISRESLEAYQQWLIVEPARREMIETLRSLPGQTAPRADLIERFGAKIVQKAIAMGGFAVFSVPIPLGESVWVRLAEADAGQALRVAQEAVQPKDEDWRAALELCGDVLRPGAQDGESLRERVLARSYTVSVAARRLGIRGATLQTAIAARQIDAFVDPEGGTRIPAAQVAAVLESPNWLQYLEDLEIVRIRELKIAFGEAQGRELYRQARRARRGGPNRVRWGQVREVMADRAIGLSQFREMYRAGKAAWEAAQAEKQAEARRKRDEEHQRRNEERRQREALRARLLAAFPTWQHPGRADQRVLLHVGPTNSGKTHEALDALCQAGSGWYLAPLRLLAFEIFDRLNRRGVRCNLLTGEEYIPVEGAMITAATIEMFNPERSGECVIIDEAQMLADPDRGWAWTRALMEAQAPEIRVVGPPFARTLIERLAGAAAMPVEVVEHQRLAPLEVARRPWPLQSVPERTILVAFSRRMVLRLKTELENYRRKVSVIYGNLPPEVRRRQADRFAEGETEICVATDAVGMGLNLPADNVCFFELEKFDGRDVRPLTAAEVHQIGGRAGRYGLSRAGQIGATTHSGLKMLRQLYQTAPETLTHARVAPAVEDLEMIPGSLARRFARWRELQSIPDALRDVIEPADIDERIALAAMLTDSEVDYLGLAAAIQLVNAPTRETSRSFWLECARRILADQSMPLPPEAPFEIESDHDLEATEAAIACADIYLWLASRREFSQFGPDEDWVRALRAEWSMSIDVALLRRLDTAARCINCRSRLPLNHRYSLCDACYGVSRRNHRSSYWR